MEVTDENTSDSSQDFSMDYLPDNIIVHIFSYLTSNPEHLLLLRQVCWRWKYLAEIESLWENVEVCFESSIFPRARAWCVPSRCLKIAPVLGILSLRRMNANYASEVVAKVQEQRPKTIKQLSILYSCIKYDDLRQLVSLLADNLETFEMLSEVMTSDGEHLTSGEIGHLPKLRTFVVWNDLKFRIVGPAWEELHEIVINYSSYRDFASSLSPEATKLIFFLHEQLRKISLKISYPSNLLTVIRHFQGILLDKFPNLEQIAFIGSVMYLFGDMSDCESRNYRPSDCDFCKMFQGLEDILNASSSLVRIVFENYGSFRCVLTCMKDTASQSMGQPLKNQYNLTIQESSEGHCVCLNVGYYTDTNLRFMTKLVDHVRGLKSITLKGCDDFQNCAKNIYSPNYPNQDFDFHSQSH